MKLRTLLLGCLLSGCGTQDVNVESSTHRIILEFGMCSEQNYPDQEERRECVDAVIEAIS